MLQACLNGGRTGPGVPVTPEALAADAAAAGALGLGHVHVHPRDAKGRESLAAADIGAAVTAIRAEAPGVAVGISTGAWIAPGKGARADALAAPGPAPDYASVNLKEPDAIEIMALLAVKGVAVEAGLWSMSDVARFLDEADPSTCCRILIEMPDMEGDAAAALAEEMLAALDGKTSLPILLHGLGWSAWPMLEMAAVEGLSSRIGFEDVTELPDGSPAASNAALIEAAATIFERYGRALS